MLADLKVKIEGTSTSTPAAWIISKNEKEIVFEEYTDSDTVSYVFAKKVFDDDLPVEAQLHINIYVENNNQSRTNQEGDIAVIIKVN